MKNKKVYGLVGVAALAAVGGTFAFYSAEQTFNNPFNTTNYGTQATEKFNPKDGDKWEPGAEVDKDVVATNTGEGDVWVRIKFDEKWTFPNAPEKSFSSVISENGVNKYNPVFDVTDPSVDLVENGHQPSKDDGMTQRDEGTVVYKNYANTTTDVTVAKKWYRGTDGYFYYTSTLTTEDPTSEKLLDSVTLCDDTDMGHFVQRYAFLKAPKGVDGGKFTYPEVPAAFKAVEGYENATWVECDEENLPKLPGKAPVLPLRDNYATIEEYQQALTTYETAKTAYDASVEEYKNVYGDQDIYTYKANVLDALLQGYANADYELNIIVEFVQADKEAAQGWDADVVAELAK